MFLHVFTVFTVYSIGCQLLPLVLGWGSCKTGMKTIIGDSPQILTLTGEFMSLQRALSGLKYGFGFELSIVMHSVVTAHARFTLRLGELWPKKWPPR